MNAFNMFSQNFIQVEGIQVHANEGGTTVTRGGIYWVILPAGCNATSHSPFPLEHVVIFKHIAQFLEV